MTTDQMWFGNVAHAQWVPHPVAGMVRARVNYEETIQYDSGGIGKKRTAAGYISYSMQFPVADASQYNGIEAFSRYASGEYGSDYLRFVDPMMQDQNLFSEPWAAPGLAEQGWKAIYDTPPAFSTVGTNSYQKPLRSATYSVTSDVGAKPTGSNSVFTLLIPPTHTLSLGATGSATGTAVLRVQPINLDGSLATVVDLSLIADATAPAFSSTFSGGTYLGVRVYITRTSTVASSITLNSMWAQMALTGSSPTISRHIPGKGHMGLQFDGNARTETYILQNRHLAGASLSLVEVEPWV